MKTVTLRLHVAEEYISLSTWIFFSFTNLCINLSIQENLQIMWAVSLSIWPYLYPLALSGPHPVYVITENELVPLYKPGVCSFLALYRIALCLPVRIHEEQCRFWAFSVCFCFVLLDDCASQPIFKELIANASMSTCWCLMFCMFHVLV